MTEFRGFQLCPDASHPPRPLLPLYWERSSISPNEEQQPLSLLTFPPQIPHLKANYHHENPQFRFDGTKDSVSSG